MTCATSMCRVVNGSKGKVRIGPVKAVLSVLKRGSRSAMLQMLRAARFSILENLDGRILTEYLATLPRL